MRHRTCSPQKQGAGRGGGGGGGYFSSRRKFSTEPGVRELKTLAGSLAGGLVSIGRSGKLQILLTNLHEWLTTPC